MASEFQTIWRHGRVYGLGSLVNRLSSLLLIPVLLHSVSAEEWGVYALILVVGRFLTVLPSALNDTMNPLYFEREDEERRRAVVAASFGFYAAFALALLVLAYPLALGLGALMFGGQDYLLPLLLAILSLVFEELFEIELDYLRARKRSGLFIALTCLRSLTQLSLGIALVLWLQMGITGIVTGHLVSYALVTLPMALWVLRRNGLTFKREIAREMLAMAWPLIPAWTAKSAQEMVERAMLNLMVSTAVMGIYDVAAKLVGQLRPLLSEPFADIWGIRLLEVAADPERAPAFNRVFVFFIGAVAAAALGLALYAPELILVLAAAEYGAAALIVPILALSYLARPGYFHFERLIIQSKRTGYLALVNWLAVAFSIVVLALLVPPLGLVGAALGELVARYARLGLAVWATARCTSHGALFPWRSVALVTAGGGACYLLSLALVGTEIGLFAFFAKPAFLALFLLWLMLGPCLTPEERAAARAALAAWLGQIRGRLARS